MYTGERRKYVMFVMYGLNSDHKEGVATCKKH